MVNIMLADAKTEADMDAIAGGFALSRDDLEHAISVGTISRWFELGEGNSDKEAHMILQSSELGLRVAVDQVGSVISSTPIPMCKLPANQPPAEREIEGKIAPEGFDHVADADADADAAHRAHLDALLDEALQESFPASDPVAISFDTSRQPVSSSKKDW